MSKIIDFEKVSVTGLESSPFPEALAGLRANEARYFKNKYDHDFSITEAGLSRETLDYVNRILKDERDFPAPGTQHPPPGTLFINILSVLPDTSNRFA